MLLIFQSNVQIYRRSKTSLHIQKNFMALSTQKILWKFSVKRGHIHNFYFLDRICKFEVFKKNYKNFYSQKNFKIISLQNIIFSHVTIVVYTKMKLFEKILFCLSAHLLLLFNLFDVFFNVISIFYKKLLPEDKEKLPLHHSVFPIALICLLVC